jgi:hypothetical protein
MTAAQQPNPEDGVGIPAENVFPAARELARLVVARVLADLGLAPASDTMDTKVVNDNRR